MDNFVALNLQDAMFAGPHLYEVSPLFSIGDFRYLIYFVSNICQLLYLLNHLVTTVESVHNGNKCKLPKQASTILFKSSTNNNALFNSTYCTCNVSSGATLMLAHRRPAWYVSLYPFYRI
jgi:hypothetical protein